MTNDQIILVIVLGYFTIYAIVSRQLILKHCRRIEKKFPKAETPGIIEKQFKAELYEFLDEHEREISN